MYFDDFFDSISSSWNRFFKEKDGYTVLSEKNGKGYLVIFNTLGVSPQDIKVIFNDDVQHQSTFITVSGATTIPEINNQLYSINYEVAFKHIQPIDNIQYKVRDGLTIVFIKTKENSADGGNIATSITDGKDFDW